MNTFSDMQRLKVFTSHVPFLSGTLLADDLHQSKEVDSKKGKDTGQREEGSNSNTRERQRESPE